MLIFIAELIRNRIAKGFWTANVRKVHYILRHTFKGPVICLDVLNDFKS